MSQIDKGKNMSQNSSFTILRKDDKIHLTDKDKQTISNILKLTKTEHDEFFDNTSTFSTLKYKDNFAQYIMIDQYHYYNISDNSIWIVVFNQNFNSDFRHIEEFNEDMTYFNNQYVLSDDEIKEIFSAVKYLLYGHYDKEIESILDNKFIESFSYLSLKYINYLTRLSPYSNITWNNINNVNDEQDDKNDTSYILENIKQICSLYLKSVEDNHYSDNKTEFKLIYSYQ